MLGETILFAVLVVAFAAWTTAHGMLVLGLLRRPRPWRAPVALLLPPLAPFWGWRHKMRWRAGLWLVAAAVYGVALARALS
jgi:hypothetical protein